MTKETELLMALQRFERKITINAIGVSPRILNNVIAQNVKIAYYLSSVSTQTTYGFVPKIVFDIQYQNTDIPQSDVYVVSSSEEVHSILCQYVGNYKAKVVLFQNKGVNIDAEYNKFHVVTAPFYPNFVAAQIGRGQFSLSPLPYYEFGFEYRIGKVKLDMMEKEIDAEVERIAKQLFLPGMSDETKAFLAHNYLAYTIQYTLNENATNLEKSYMQSAYGALIKKKCVCQGYAEAFKRLMDYTGIACDIVCGQIKDSTTYHAWNIIKLNNGTENYHIDVTWDSTGGRVAYTYFGLKDSDLDKERTWNKSFNAKCNSDNSKLLLEAKRGIMRFKSKLLANGADVHIFGY